MNKAQAIEWFKGSVVVDEIGDPLVVYHGTTAGHFDRFQPHMRRNEALGFGIHFAEQREFAERYAFDPNVARRGRNPVLYAAILRAERPLMGDVIVSELDPLYDLAKRLAGRQFQRLMPQLDEKGVRWVYLQKAIDATSAKTAERVIREAGYDAVHYKARNERNTPYGRVVTAESPSWVVFEPDQVLVMGRAETPHRSG